MNTWIIVFYSNLNIEDITDAEICKDFKTKSLGKYHDLYVQSNALLDALLMHYLSWNIWSSPSSFSNFTRVSMESNLGKIKVRLDLLTDIDMLSMVENVIRRGIYHAIHQYGKANDK